MSKVISSQIKVCAAAVEITASGLAPGQSQHIQLLPIGPIVLRDGRPDYVVTDAAHAQRVIDATRSALGRQDLAVDYDHQSLFGAQPGVGGRAPAAGWIKPQSLAVQADGIWGDVQWTAAAAAAIAAREYRYLSPVFIGPPAGGPVARLGPAALTNNPAIENLAAIAAAHTAEGSEMDLTALAKALGLGADATLEQIAASIATLKTAHDAAAAHLTAIGAGLGLAAGSGAEAIVAAARTARQVDASQYVPIAAFTELQTTVKALTEGAADKAADAAVAAAVAAGKVTPAQKAWAGEYARKDLAGFEAYVAAAAVIVAPADRRTTATPPGSGETLTDAEKAVCATMGWDEAKFLAAKKEAA